MRLFLLTALLALPFVLWLGHQNHKQPDLPTHTPVSSVDPATGVLIYDDGLGHVFTCAPGGPCTQRVTARH